jgi:hypothetical protein
MRRRGLLTAVAVALAGCTGAGGGAGDDRTATDTETPSDTATSTPTATPTPSGTPTPTRVTDTSFTATGRCAREGDPTVDVDDGTATVTVEGCVRGRNGCAEARLGGAEYDPTSGRLEVVVRTVVDTPPDTVCTQALTALGYRATVAFDAGTPATVAVVHDDVDGRRQVAVLER